MLGLKMVRIAVIVIGAGGIAGMIIGSLADNNNGAVVTAGMTCAVASLVLMSFTAASRQRTGLTPTPRLDETIAADLEAHIAALVEAGADEAAVRATVGLAVRLGRGATADH